MRGLIGVIGAILFASNVFASGNRCEALVQDLKSMQAAQQELLGSYNRKNETMAEVLDQQADRLEKNLILHQSLKRTDLKSLRLSAEAFRNHQQKEMIIVDKFEKASGELLSQVETCLNSSNKVEKTDQR